MKIFKELYFPKILLVVFVFFSLPVFGQIKVIDGDTLIFKGEKIRLDGIDAPETAQTCIKNNKTWNCGKEATSALKNLIGQISDEGFACEGKTKDKYDRRIATCFHGHIHINEWMVENGWAIAYRYYSKKYIKSENKARQNKKGLWQGEFISPWNWRKGKRLLNKKVNSLCSIKGNISSSGEKIYHTPDGTHYSKTKITEQKGEKWFCSEEEALRNGWRKSKR